MSQGRSRGPRERSIRPPRTLRVEVRGAEPRRPALCRHVCAGEIHAPRTRIRRWSFPPNVFVFFVPTGTQVAVVTDRKQNSLAADRDRARASAPISMEVLKGLDENAKVVMNPTDDLTEGAGCGGQTAGEKRQGWTERKRVNDFADEAALSSVSFHDSA